LGSGKWRLANHKKQNGQPGQTKDFLERANELKCALVTVPISMDPKLATSTASGIVGAGIRSFELLWDGMEKELSPVIAAEDHDLNNFKQAFSNMYPNADFADMSGIKPDWFDESEEY